jgi:CubicO group peptidase (beta-lactamase class C family)
MGSALPVDFHMDLWQDGPLNRWAFQHVDEFLTTQEICAKETSRHRTHSITDLPAETKLPIVNLLEELDVSVEGKIYKLTKILEDTHTDSILVLRNGKVVYEKYFNGMEAESKHLLQSVSKSMLGVLYARMIDKGIIDPEQRLGHYLPELNSSAFGSATIAQALDMQVALNFSEDYASPHSEMTRLDRACGWKTNTTGEYPTLRSFLPSLTSRISDVTKMPLEHGSEFQYCSATTDVLAWLIAHVTGEPYSKLLERELWRPMGAQHNANITVDSEGLAVGNGGMSCTTRDMALLGEVILNGGKVPSGEQVIPPSWIKQTTRANQYKNQWWINMSPRAHAYNEIYGCGIYGQYLWVDQHTSTVIAKFSSDPEAKSSTKYGMHISLFRAICSWIPEFPG